MKVLIAPDSFKGSASAVQVATWVRDGWLAERPDDHVVLAPMADGGEGTVDAFATAVAGARLLPVRVTGPCGGPVECHWVLLPDGTGVVELASASGITLLSQGAPFEASSTGFGEVVAHALDHGVRRLLLGLGGSSSTDGGTGLLTALGARFLDGDGRPVPPGNAGLGHVAVADLSDLRPLPPGGAVVLSDVDNPLLGPRGASAVFGPQKGAGPADVPRLEANLGRLVDVLGADPAAPGAGAAGGAGYGLLRWGARMSSGSAAVGEALQMPDLVSAADLVITGEGRYDDQSAAGKVPWYLQSLASTAGVPVLLVAGSTTAPTTPFQDAVALSELAGGTEEAIAAPEVWLRQAAALLARRT